MTTKTKIIILVVSLLVVLGGLAGVLIANGVFDKEKPKPAKKEVVKEVNPLTGLELTGKEMKRPFVVSTDNDSYLSRPQAGLSQADILYEVPIEGGGSRYEPIYYTYEPGLVGAVRSCRPYIINIAREYNAVLVHNGNSPQAKEIFDTIDRVSAADDFDVFHQEDNPNLPGNLYTYGKEIIKRMDKKKFNKEKVLRTFPWLEEDEKAEGADASTITCNYYDGAYNTFKYDAKTKLYTKYVKDQPLIDANNSKEITCANVLIQEVPFQLYTPGGENTSDAGSQRLDIDMTKGGKATMFTQGKVVKGTWERKDLDSPTIFKDKEGNEFKMTPGVTWIQLIDSTVKFSYKK